MRIFQDKRLSLIAAVCLALTFLVAFTIFSDITTISLRSLFRIPSSVASFIFKTSFELLHFKSIASENLRLHNKVTALEAGICAFEELKAENNRLKELLSLKERLSVDSVACRVIGREISNWTENLIVDKGSKDGLRKDMAVLANSAVIGKIAAAGRSSARVLLLTDPEMRISVISQRTRVEGLIYGIGRRRAIMKFIPKDADIKQGDIIVTSGLGGIYPGGILAGKVLNIKFESNRLYKFALIEPAVNTMAVEEVMAVK